MSQQTSNPAAGARDARSGARADQAPPVRGLLGWARPWRSIRSKIVAVATALIVLMLAASIASMMMSATVSLLLEELTSRYVPAYSHLARANVRSLERALALRRMAIAKMAVPPDDDGYKAQIGIAREKDGEVARETSEARKLINAIIDDKRTHSGSAALGRLDARIENATSELRRELSEEDARLIELLDTGDLAGARHLMAHIDIKRDQFTRQIEGIRSDMLAQVFARSAGVIRDQHRALATSAVVSFLAALLGIGVAMVVASGITRPVRALLQGTRDVESGRLDGEISVSTKDEIGELSVAFNRMLEQLRKNRRVRETFGRYIDPKVAEGLLDRPENAAPDGQRRVMTVMFCDMRGFTSLSEGMTPQGLVKVLNCFLSAMSAPIRESGGIIDKYIGDAIMAYWGPPFVDDAEQAALACAAASEMARQLPAVRSEFPALLGLRQMPGEIDIRIGIATGEVLAGSIGSELMMSYTVLGDAVNLASRLESLNKTYGTRILVSERTAQMAGARFETREVDRVIVYGHETQNTVHELLGEAGSLSPAQEALRTAYARGLAAYRQGAWGEARAAFEEIGRIAPADGPTRTLMSRLEALESRPQPGAWDGSWRMDSK